MDIIQDANNRADLILPKLQALRNKAGGGRIHKVITWLGIVQNSKELLNMTTRLDPEEVAADLISACDEAEKFMMEVVR